MFGAVKPGFRSFLNCQYALQSDGRCDEYQTQLSSLREFSGNRRKCHFGTVAPFLQCCIKVNEKLIDTSRVTSAIRPQCHRKCGAENVAFFLLLEPLCDLKYAKICPGPCLGSSRRSPRPPSRLGRRIPFPTLHPLGKSVKQTKSR